MKRIRIAWSMKKGSGHGEHFDPKHREWLQDWIEFLNKGWGNGTHWIEEIEIQQ